MPDNLSIVDLGKLTEPATKLIEAVAEAVGVVYEPTRIRRKAAAEADAEIMKAKAKIEIDEIGVRAARRREAQELRRQKNIDAIVSQAIQLLPASVSEEKVDEDWIVQFFNYGQDVSNEEMQLVWAKLLVGEVSNPGSFSLRTLQVVRILSQADAQRFRLLCNYLWKDRQYFHSQSATEIVERKGLGYTDLLALESLGLLIVSKTYAPIPDGETITENYFGRIIRITNPGNRPGFSRKGIDVDFITTVGKELAPICGGEPDKEYLDALVKDWRGENFHFQVEVDTESGEAA